MKKDDYTIIYSGGTKHTYGVGISIDKTTAKSIAGFQALSERVVLVKFHGSPFDLSIIQAYSPTSDANTAELEKFYESLDEAKRQCKSSDIVIVIGDLNAKVGNGRESYVVGPYGLGERNANGDNWVEWCMANGHCIMNTWFKNHPRRLWTWVSPDGETKNQIDYITVNKRFRSAISDCKTYPGADCYTDHAPVIATLRVKLKNISKNTAQPRIGL